MVLVHGAFEDAAAWSGVTARLQRDGYRVLVPAVPLRGIAGDSAAVSDVVRSIDGPVVLVGHSYAGLLISQVAATTQNIKALVYTNAFIPQAGETLQGLNAKFPGSLLGPDTITVVDHADGPDVTIQPASFRAVVAGDLPADKAAVAAAGQRPLTIAAMTEPVRAAAPASVPKYALVGSRDRAIAPAAERWMAQRAGAEYRVVDSAHDMPVSHPAVVTAEIEKAARTSR
ncbi:alpha/beta fold hydrolase [Actinacidiphila glaucinigra]|uniref:alpha/beta fold hydrolase n=1 Tax=Actinacidiphila glaucinigra TaxID=235986 RepID=UPI0035DE1168